MSHENHELFPLSDYYVRFIMNINIADFMEIIVAFLGMGLYILKRGGLTPENRRYMMWAVHSNFFDITVDRGK